jgi:hypothetical protein
MRRKSQILKEIKALIKEYKSLNENVSKFQRDLMIDSDLKPGMKITSIKDIGNGDYLQLVINGKTYDVSAAGGNDVTYYGWNKGESFKSGVIKSIKTPNQSTIELHLKDGRMLEFVDDTGGEGISIGTDLR